MFAAATTAAREWGWKRRRELRDELRAFAERTPNKTALAAAEVLSLDLAESGRRRAMGRLNSLKTAPLRVLVWKVTAAMVVLAIGVVGVLTAFDDVPFPFGVVKALYFTIAVVLSGVLLVDSVRTYRRRVRSNKAALDAIDIESLNKPLV
ncbi:hypothetical protein JVX92_15125 (plasmid) [Microbacterium hominis]|uniref:hypothetical protein n=1 Tax=Microbacterium hominis TaxID=162426 RepID=UPI001964BA3B|nr:hypothetical protein [Microbacterium hominis]QRY42312.1 hypothetical protein JVX92_15125 [Microbacterium hominis]